MADELDIEFEIDPEWARVRRMKEREYMRAGISEFTAFRLALLPDLDWHKVVDQAKAGATDDQLTRIYLD